jgi:hypothetical protein
MKEMERKGRTHISRTMDDSVADIILKANVEFLNENYETSVEHYNMAIKLDDSNSDIFVQRSFCLEKLARLQGKL